MDIDHAPKPLIDKPGRQNAHKTGQDDHFDAVPLKLSLHGAFERFAIWPKRLVIDGDGTDSCILRCFQASGVGTIGQHQDRLRRIIDLLRG